jgi:hypothetical protein
LVVVVRRGVRRTILLGGIVATMSTCVAGLAVEGAVRLRREPRRTDAPAQVGRMVYHPTLGWVQRPGRFGDDWIWTVDSAGIRSNGTASAPAGRPVLVIGDSFAFGDEVGDHETWTAQLERLIDRPVINAGVGAYGIDQAVLRGEDLLGRFAPDVVILSFISDDISRTEFSFYPYGWGWKPYFEAAADSLILRNVPVPEDPHAIPTVRWATLRRVLRHSAVAEVVLRRLAPAWWLGLPKASRVHHDGEEVSLRLIARLDSIARDRGTRFVTMSLATNGQTGDNARTARLVRLLQARGLDVLDLAATMAGWDQERFRAGFRPRGHYGPELNRLVAEHVAARLVPGSPPPRLLR